MEHSKTQDGGQRGRLDDLPPSDDKDFWLDAEIHTNLSPRVPFMEQPHYFVRISGRQAQCTHCDWGFQLDPGDKIIDGHLYDRSGKLIL